MGPFTVVTSRKVVKQDRKFQICETFLLFVRTEKTRYIKKITPLYLKVSNLGLSPLDRFVIT